MKHKINVEEYRKKNFISQNKLAKKINISQSYLSAVERELKSPTLRMLYRIAKELDVCPRLLIRCKIECKECNKNINVYVMRVKNNEKIIAIYARKSLFTGKGDSIGAQVDTCKRFIDYKFANEDYEIRTFKDEGWSGKTTDRPDFTNMVNLIKSKKIDYVITYKLDRIGRTARDLHNFLYELDNLGIVYLSATEPYDTTTSAGRFMISILAAMAQMERERLAERVKSGMIQIAKKGRWLGGQCPLGFDSKREIYIDDMGKERQMMKLTPNKEEIKIVKLIYDKYLEMGSMSQVRKYCLENSIRGKNGGDFSTNTLKQLLTSPIYVKSSDNIFKYLESQNINVFGTPNGNGMLTFNKTKEIRIERDKSEWIAAVGKHKGIIDDNKWLQIQQQLQQQSEKQIKSSGRQGTTSTGLLSGIIKCAKCDSNLLIKTGHKSKKILELHIVIMYVVKR